LTAHALGLSPLEVATREQEPVNKAGAHRVAALAERRMTGESVARIIGEREFYGLPFRLNAATLEPRPETELLVDLAIPSLPPGGRLLDLGTGTGCIPIAVLANRSDATALAIDLAPEALTAARENAERNGVSKRLEVLQSDWFTALDASQRFDFIVSNPPYIASEVLQTLAPEVRAFDPPLALDGGPDGLAPYRIIAARASAHLKSSGSILVEIGFDQGKAVCALFRAAGFAEVQLHQDLNGLDRVVHAHHLSRSERTAQ
jgi:release factor glutamine methyltransferase